MTKLTNQYRSIVNSMNFGSSSPDLNGLRRRSRETQELLQGILNAINSSADGIIIYDLDGNVKHVSDSFTRLFGWTKEELLGKRIPFMPESEQEASLAQINRLIQDGKPVSGFETRRLTKDGSPFGCERQFLAIS